MNYITKEPVRENGVVKEAEAMVNGIYLTYRRGKDGKPVEASRTRPAMVYDRASQYIPREHYVALIKQVHGVFAEIRKPKQMGFDFTKEETHE